MLFRYAGAAILHNAAELTPQSAEILIGQLKEIAARHQKIQTNTAQQINATPDDNPRQPPTDEAVKRGTPEKRDEKHRAGEDEQAIEALQARLKELENQNFKLEIDKSAQDQVIGMMRDQMTQQTKEFSNQLTEQSRRVGQLETEMRQLMAPKHDRRPTRDDDGAPDVAAPIDAEFIDASRVAQDELDDVQTNHASQP